MKLTECLKNKSPLLISSIAISVSVLVGVSDAFTGKEIAFSILYLVPVMFAAWYADKMIGIVVSAVSVAAWVVADAVSGLVYSTVWIHVWNAASRLGIYLIVVHLVDMVKKNQALLKSEIEKTSIDLSLEKVEHRRTFESVKRLSMFPEFNPDPIIEIDSYGKLTYFNKAAGDFLDEHGLTDYSILFPEDIDEILGMLMSSGEEILVREKNIGHIVLEEYVYLIHSLKVVQIYAKDITERKGAEEEIKRSLKEKEILLREIHHRVKNNLQIISSLLKLQAGRIKDKEDLVVFVESQRRINSIAQVHQMLYKQGDVSNIEAEKFVNELASKLLSLYQAESQKVRFDISAEGIILDADIANPLGLLLTEIISNSFKYAFEKGKEGIVTIIMSKGDGNNLRIEIGDNGKGFNPEERKDKSPTLGLQLISMLAQQIDAVTEMDFSEGTKYIFEIKNQ